MQNNPNLQSIKNMMNLIRGSNNPQAELQNMIVQNPQMRQVMDLVRKNGGNYQQAFFALARQRGVDPNVILQELQHL